MVDGVEVVAEAGQRPLLRAETAAVLAPSLDKQDLEAGLRQIVTEDQAVVARPDDDAVVAGVVLMAHAIYSPPWLRAHACVRIPAGPR